MFNIILLWCNLSGNLEMWLLQRGPLVLGMAVDDVSVFFCLESKLSLSEGSGSRMVSLLVCLYCELCSVVTWVEFGATPACTVPQLSLLHSEVSSLNSISNSMSGTCGTHCLHNSTQLTRGLSSIPINAAILLHLFLTTQTGPPTTQTELFRCFLLNLLSFAIF